MERVSCKSSFTISIMCSSWENEFIFNDYQLCITKQMLGALNSKLFGSQCHCPPQRRSFLLSVLLFHATPQEQFLKNSFFSLSTEASVCCLSLRDLQQVCQLKLIFTYSWNIRDFKLTSCSKNIREIIENSLLIMNPLYSCQTLEMELTKIHLNVSLIWMRCEYFLSKLQW